MASKVFIWILVLATTGRVAYCGQRVDIVLSARDIPDLDPLGGKPDPFVKVYYRFDSSQNYIEYGQTSVSDDNSNPDWPQVFSFDYADGDHQVVRFDLYDEDVWFNDLIGAVELPLGEVVRAALDNSGKVERNFVPVDSGRILMKVRIDGTIPSPQLELPNPVVALLTKKY